MTQIPVSKNEVVTSEIIGLTHEGEGVGRINGFTLFIQGALPGEQVRAKVLKVKKQYGYAKLLEIVQASPDRVDAPCEIYAQCGGCQLQHMSYEAQLRWKRQHVVDNLERIGKLQTVVHDTIGMDEPWRYRNKAQVPFGMAVSAAGTAADGSGGGLTGAATTSRRSEAAGRGSDGRSAYARNRAGSAAIRAAGRPGEARGGNAAGESGLTGADGGRLIGGFYARGSHRIIDMDACLIQDERNDEVVRVIKQLGRELGITAYDEESGRGLLRHVMVRSGYVSGETMVVLITNGRKIPQVERWIAGIREALPNVRSIVQNVNTRSTNVIFGDETRVLWGSETIEDELDGIRFAISARSFYQVNPQQTIALYKQALAYAGLTGAETVIDAYCGIGTISLFLAREAGQVYGVEIVPEAIEDARRNAALNGLKNVKFEVGASEVVIPRWRKEGIVADVIVVDPPRKGCDAELLETILAMQPKRVVYVSCNPSTLARDLRVLEDGGYRTVEVQPVDMFPWTSHVEAVVGMQRIDT
ncbi:23S rRNA (uracil(1939)-C(5))-methyltransferase RlmD [Paenibacillaceae bacterium]|nr:23S rRNA (uracil(1939)-C(5))-methyltransferase RlmD [Paenibacillaceae bacterium]